MLDPIAGEVRDAEVAIAAGLIAEVGSDRPATSASTSVA